MVWYFLLAVTMLIVWLVCAFGLITETITIPANSTDATTIEATSLAIEIDSSDAISDLEKAESKDAKQLEIIKQIRRVNTDGSYTVGYEAVDGTFKIESRDVLGNVKGTYGYVDENGEIKRVSYTANNTTNGLKSAPQPVAPMPRSNNKPFTASSTTRRPSHLAHLTSSTASPLRANSKVIQAIPKPRILLASAVQTSSKNPYTSNAMTTKKMEFTSEAIVNSQKTEPTTTIVYATSIRSTAKPVSMSTTEPTRSNKIEIIDRISKVNKNTKTITSDSSEQIETKSERKPVRGNALRRQLPSDQSENFESHSQVILSQSSDEDSVHSSFFGGSGSQRPIFSTTSSPRIPALVLAARNRAAMLKNAAIQSTTEKVHIKPSRRKSERRDENRLTTETISHDEYLTQSPVAVQIPANRDALRDNEHVYRHPNAYLPRSREHLRHSQPSITIEREQNNPGAVQVQPTFVQNDVENEQYLRETSESSDKRATTSNPEQYVSSDSNAATQPFLQSFNPRAQRLYGARQGARNDFDQRLQQQQSIPVPVQPYQPQPIFGSPNFIPPNYDHPDRPLTARDFERLLNLLVVRHQQFNRINYLPGLMGQNYFGGGGGGGGGGGYNGYGGFGGFGAGSGYGGFFGGYNPYNYQQIPRAPLYNQFDPRYTAFSRSLPPVPPPNSLSAPYSEQENLYQAQSPVEQQIPYMQRSTQSRRNSNNQQFNNQQFNNQQYFDRSESNDISQQKVALPQNDRFLPPEIREELLYRMLMLAIQPDVGATMPVPDASTIQEYFKATMPATATTAAPEPNSKKPVRSVQIIGEE